MAGCWARALIQRKAASGTQRTPVRHGKFSGGAPRRRHVGPLHYRFRAFPMPRPGADQPRWRNQLDSGAEHCHCGVRDRREHRRQDPAVGGRGVSRRRRLRQSARDRGQAPYQYRRRTQLEPAESAQPAHPGRPDHDERADLRLPPRLRDCRWRASSTKAAARCMAAAWRTCCKAAAAACRARHPWARAPLATAASTECCCRSHPAGLYGQRPAETAAPAIRRSACCTGVARRAGRS
jgi:hypothetical protein